MKQNKILYGIIVILALVILITRFVPSNPLHSMSMEEKRDTFIELKEDIQGDLLPQGQYRCCLEKPCTYCIEKTPGHGEGAICDCLADIVDGRHPCGECIGEILEGHGNPYLAEYFPEAIAEEVGMQHLDSLKRIIAEKYETYSYN